MYTQTMNGQINLNLQAICQSEYYFRIMFFKNQRDHADHLFKSLRIVPIKNLSVFKFLRTFLKEQ